MSSRWLENLRRFFRVRRMFDPVEALVSNFDCYHRYFQTSVFGVADNWREPPIRHRDTIAQRGNRPAAEAIADVEFMASLRRTLSVDFRVRTRLRDPLVVPDALHQCIQQLDGVRLEDATPAILDALWDLIEHIQLNEGRAKLVVNTKALAHVLTELVVPIDRTYTAAFLFRFGPEFDEPRDEKEIFFRAFSVFRSIAQRVDLVRFVSGANANDWNTTRPKVIDNAIIGFVEHTRAALSARAVE